MCSIFFKFKLIINALKYLQNFVFIRILIIYCLIIAIFHINNDYYLICKKFMSK